MSISAKLKEIAAEIEKLESKQVDTDLEEARKLFPVGRRFEWRYGISAREDKVISVYRDKVYRIRIEGEVGSYAGADWYYDSDTKDHFTLLPNEPKWPDFIKDGTWLYWSEQNEKYYITDKKPERFSGTYRSAKFGYSYHLEGFLSATNYTIKDLQIPDVPPGERCWVKGDVI